MWEAVRSGATAFNDNELLRRRVAGAGGGLF